MPPSKPTPHHPSSHNHNHNNHHNNHPHPNTHTDLIDALDNTSPHNPNIGIYHHAGPYDAALPAHNAHAETAPLAALRESNREALRATPRARVVDSVTRHVPLVGTASVPAGEVDFWDDYDDDDDDDGGRRGENGRKNGRGNGGGKGGKGGRVMRYEEGADLMREADAEGGPYKRYEHVQYHPEDLKGKGEPSYTIERDLKNRKKRKD